jgi:hypothetical protein
VFFSSFYKPTNHNFSYLGPNPYSQFTKTSAYIQIVGFIDNTAIGLNALDKCGELDPHRVGVGVAGILPFANGMISIPRLDML